MTTSEERAAPTAQPEGMVAGGVELLAEAARLFRSYEASHRAKATGVYAPSKASGPDHLAGARADTIAKAEVNAEIAARIERFLAAAPAPLRADAPTNWFDGTEDADGNPLRADAGEVERIAGILRDNFQGAVFEEAYSENGHRQVEQHDATEHVEDVARQIVAALSPASSAPEGEAKCREALEALLEVCTNHECGETDWRLAIKDARAALKGDADHG